MSLQFGWDPSKDAANWARHWISFEEAMTVFADPLARIFDDPDHSVDEHRELIIGHSSEQRLLIVSFVERERIIRLISARRVTRHERQKYEDEGQT
jgi:uncharacterized DUF497 family protein